MQSNRFLYTVIAVQALALGYLGLQSHQPMAMAQGVPDAGAQLDQIIQQTKATNAKFDRLLALLESGKVQVITKSDDKAK